MSIWVDCYVVETEGEDPVYYELFSDQAMAEDYARLQNETVRANSEFLVVRHTIVDISEY